jgi:hypothetical protein
MKRTVAIAIGAVVAFGSLLGLAGADRKAITDPSGDSTGPGFDIVKATAKHRGERKLVHTLKMAGPLEEDLSDYQFTLMLNVDGDPDCEREFHAPPIGRSPMVRCGIGDTSKFGRVTKPNARTLVYTFKRATVIGGKRKYKWRMRIRPCPGGPPCGDEIDAAPDDRPAGGLKYITHKLD